MRPGRKLPLAALLLAACGCTGETPKRPPSPPGLEAPVVGPEGQEGHGGAVHVCYTDSTYKKIDTVEFYDLYEFRIEHGIPRSFALEGESVDEILKRVYGRLGMVPRLAELLEKYVEYVRDNVDFKDSVPELNDAHPKHVGQNCRYEQLGIWNEKTGKIETKEPYFRMLRTHTEVAMYYTHEAFYFLYRDLMKKVDSDQSRDTNGRIFFLWPIRYTELASSFHRELTGEDPYWNFRVPSPAFNTGSVWENAVIYDGGYENKFVDVTVLRGIAEVSYGKRNAPLRMIAHQSVRIPFTAENVSFELSGESASVAPYIDLFFACDEEVEILIQSGAPSPLTTARFYPTCVRPPFERNADNMFRYRLWLMKKLPAPALND